MPLLKTHSHTKGHIYMNKILLKIVNSLPQSLLIKFVRFYVSNKINKHAHINVEGHENLDSNFDRPFLFVCNHLSNSDGLVLNQVLKKENIIFVAGKKLEANSFTNLGFNIVRSIPISPSSADKTAIKKVVSAVKEGNNILIFPEGTRSRTSKMLEGKKGILLFAKLTNAPIVPLGIWGTEKFMPIENDMGKEAFYDADINIKIGEPYKLAKKSDDETKEEWEAQSINHIMTSIAKLIPTEYRGFYEDKI